MKSREELLANFGAPAELYKYSHGPDLISFEEYQSGDVTIFEKERWIYSASHVTQLTEDRFVVESGKTLFEFVTNREDSKDLLIDINWLSDHEYDRLVPR